MYYDKLLLFSIITLVFLSNLGKADEQETHFAAHFGMSYAINAFTYGLSKQALHLEPMDAFVFSAVATLAVGAIYKFTEIAPGAPNTLPRAMLQNTCGVLAFGLTALMFKF